MEELSQWDLFCLVCYFTLFSSFLLLIKKKVKITFYSCSFWNNNQIYIFKCLWIILTHSFSSTLFQNQRTGKFNCTIIWLPDKKLPCKSQFQLVLMCLLFEILNIWMFDCSGSDWMYFPWLLWSLKTAGIYLFEWYLNIG